jgi:hypothetical protein
VCTEGHEMRYRCVCRIESLCEQQYQLKGRMEQIVRGGSGSHGGVSREGNPAMFSNPAFDEAATTTHLDG